MDRYWEISCLSCSYDLEDKFSLSHVDPLPGNPLVLCQMELRETTGYQPPRSSAVQSQICRFMQEAIQAQFHLMRTFGVSIKRDVLERALKTAGQQLDFFLKSHQWHAQISAAIFLAKSTYQDTTQGAVEPDEIEVICVGEPNLYMFEGFDLRNLTGPENLPKRGFGELYPFTMNMLTITITRPVRLLLAAPRWQQVRPSLLAQLFKEGWLKLPELLLHAIQANELDHSPFFLVQLRAPVSPWRRWIAATYQSLEHGLSKLLRLHRR